MKGILLELPKCSPLTFVFAFFRMIGGICSSIIWPWLLLPPPTFLAFFGFVGTFYYLSSYIYGILNSKNYVFLLSILGAFEMLSPLHVLKTKSLSW